jgi:hypothetical protein
VGTAAETKTGVPPSRSWNTVSDEPASWPVIVNVHGPVESLVTKTGFASTRPSENGGFAGWYSSSTSSSQKIS